MSVEYSLEIGLGIVISDKVANQIFDRIESRFDMVAVDEFRDEYCRQINGWTGGDYFLGFTEALGDESVIPFNHMEYGAVDYIEIIEVWQRWQIWDIVDNLKVLPSTYLINFCY